MAAFLVCLRSAARSAANNEYHNIIIDFQYAICLFKQQEQGQGALGANGIHNGYYSQRMVWSSEQNWVEVPNVHGVQLSLWHENALAS